METITPQRPPVKEKGIIYRLTHDCDISGIILPKGYSLHECVDGWFQSFNINGHKFFLRLSPEVVNEIKHRE